MDMTEVVFGDDWNMKKIRKEGLIGNLKPIKPSETMEHKASYLLSEFDDRRPENTAPCKV